MVLNICVIRVIRGQKKLTANKSVEDGYNKVHFFQRLNVQF